MHFHDNMNTIKKSFFSLLLVGCFLLPFFFGSNHLIAREKEELVSRLHKGLWINIISHSLINGAGKQIDVTVLTHELEKHGCVVHLCDYYKVDKIQNADINIFLAQTKPEWYSQGTLNWFIPNAEFCTLSKEELKQFDQILCKTKESFRIFSSLSKKAIYVGFTGVDRRRFKLSEKKDYSKCLLVAGKSPLKGHKAVIQAWLKNSKLPEITILKQGSRITSEIASAKNIQFLNRRISSELLLHKQNQIGIHLCPSETEGYGHSLSEGMSVASVVVTTDAPPMNEFITDPRCLVKVKSSYTKEYATLYVVDEENLARVVKNLQKLSPQELRDIGKRNRKEFLRRKGEFEENFHLLMKKTVELF